MLGKFFKKPASPDSRPSSSVQYLASGFPVLTYGDTPQIKTEELVIQGLGKGGHD
jgi:hypothetical protein